MNKLIVTEVNNTSKTYTLSEVNVAILMMHGIDYTKDNGVLVFSIDKSDGWLFNIDAMLNRLLGI